MTDHNIPQNSFDENKKSGWVKLYRSIFFSYLKGDANAIAVLACILALVDRKDRFSGNRQVEKVGRMETTVAGLSSLLGLSPSCVRRCLQTLNSANTIRVETTNKKTFISVINWDTYQQNESVYNKQDANNPPLNKKLRIKEPKNNKINSTSQIASLTPSERGVLDEWVSFSSEASKTKITPDQEKYAEAILKLKRLCGVDGVRLGEVLGFVRSDDFWRPNAISLPGLLTKSKTTGLRKIENILQAMDKKSKDVDRDNPMRKSLNEMKAVLKERGEL